MAQTTSTNLLARLRQPALDQQAWSDFTHLYGRLVLHWVLQAGFKPADAEDVVQEIFVHLFPRMQVFEYDREKKFRSWLKTVVLNKCRDLQRRKTIPTCELLDDAIVGADPAAKARDEEEKAHVLQCALKLMKSTFPKTWLIVWQLTVEGQSAAEVAATHGMTVGAVTAAKFRVLSRMRAEFGALVDQ